MAMNFSISTWNSSTAPEARTFTTRKRRDAALGELWAQIYAMLAADGGLDTARAWRLHNEFEEFAGAVNSGLARGHYRSGKFVLRTDTAGDLQHVLFTQRRD